MKRLSWIYHALFGGSPWSTALGVAAVAAFLGLGWRLATQVHRTSLPPPPPAPPLVRPLERDPSILLLNAYHPGYSWSDHEGEGFLETLQKARPDLQTRVEHLDAKHHPGLEHFPALRDLLRAKYGTTPFRLVVAADNPALVFALRYRDDLFPGVPIVFMGIDGYGPELLAGHTGITGIAQRLEAARTLEIALPLHPRTRRVVVIHDHTLTGQESRREVEGQLASLAGRVQLQFLSEPDLDRLGHQLRSLPADSLVLGLSYSLDGQGRVVNHEAFTRFLRQHAQVPVYGLHGERLGHGIVGGVLTDGKVHGRRAADLALRILAGENTASLPVQTEAQGLLGFDHAELLRFGLSERDLPPGATIIHRPTSFLQTHRDLALTTAGLFLLLLGGLAAVALNVYRRVQVEERHRSLQAQLLQSQKMEAVGHLAGGVAHDFNNILTAIMGYASLLQMKLEGDAAKAHVDQILGASERGAHLIRSLLAFSRKGVLESKPLPLDAIAQGVEKIVRRLIGEDITLEVQLGGSGVRVMGDLAHLEQVVVNLCTNARDAMPDGGRLTLETRCLPAAPQGSFEGPAAVISVKDTGTGIPPSVRPRIFEPFYTTKEVGKGTGLGLSVAYGIIRQHGGVVTVESEPGVGSTFHLFLPALPATAFLEDTEDGRLDQAPGGQESILLVEDEAPVRSLMAAVLREAGYRVMEAADGLEALKLQEDGAAFDLLLTDVIMPRMNGRALQVAVQARAPQTRVLFISGYTADIIEHRGALPPGSALVLKPVRPATLLRRVRDVLDA